MTMRMKGRAAGLVSEFASTSLFILLFVGSNGCRPCPRNVAFLCVQGKILDSQTLEGATDTVVGGRTFTDGEQTDFYPPRIYDDSPTSRVPDEDGTFKITFTRLSESCQDVFTEFLQPDRIEIIVARGDCQYTFSIDINEDTVVDMAFPDDTLELKDPILVPPCELEPGD